MATAQFDFDAWAKAEGWSTSWMPLPKPAPSPFASAERLAQIALRSVEGVPCPPLQPNTAGPDVFSH